MTHVQSTRHIGWWHRNDKCLSFCCRVRLEVPLTLPPATHEFLTLKFQPPHSLVFVKCIEKGRKCVAIMKSLPAHNLEIENWNDNIWNNRILKPYQNCYCPPIYLFCLYILDCEVVIWPLSMECTPRRILNIQQSTQRLDVEALFKREFCEDYV